MLAIRNDGSLSLTMKTLIARKRLIDINKLDTPNIVPYVIEKKIKETKNV